MSIKKKEGAEHRIRTVVRARRKGGVSQAPVPGQAERVEAMRQRAEAKLPLSG
jgi:hypothetical protein